MLLKINLLFFIYLLYFFIIIIFFTVFRASNKYHETKISIFRVSEYVITKNNYEILRTFFLSQKNGKIHKKTNSRRYEQNVLKSFISQLTVKIITVFYYK